jgi:hypothetical protein
MDGVEMTENKPEIGDDERLFLEAAQSESSQDLMPYYEYCRAEIAQSARESALLEAARAVCKRCAHGETVEYCAAINTWIHRYRVGAYDDGWDICDAEKIHDLRAKE